MTKTKGRSVRAMGPGLIRIEDGGKVDHYGVREIKTELEGRAFSVRKITEAQPYSVVIGKPSECSCECLGFLRWSKCRHVSALLALETAGRI